MDDKTVLYDIYNECVEDIFLNINIIDFEELFNIENELSSFKGYLPVLIRNFIYNEYKDKETLSKIDESRYFSFRDAVLELIDWVSEYEQYMNLIKEDRWNLLNKELSLLNREYDICLKKI